MSKILKTILITILVTVVAVAVGMFAIYKFFITPEMILKLSMVQAGKDIKSSFNILAEQERELFDDILKNGSKTELFFEVEDIPFIGGKQVSVISNTDTVVSGAAVSVYGNLSAGLADAASGGMNVVGGFTAFLFRNGKGVKICRQSRKMGNGVGLAEGAG